MPLNDAPVAPPLTAPESGSPLQRGTVPPMLSLPDGAAPPAPKGPAATPLRSPHPPERRQYRNCSAD